MRCSTLGIRMLAIVAVVGVTACGGDDAASPTSTDSTPAVTTTTVPTTDATTTTLGETSTTSVTTAPVTTAPPPTTTGTTAGTTTTTTPVSLVDVRVYLLRGERLAIEHRDVAGPAVLRGAIEALLAGPGPNEPELLTAVPAGTTLRGVDLDDGVATVDLSGEFDTGGGSASVFARIGQVVFTATQFDNVDAVRFWIDGAPVDYLTGEGIVMTEPWTRAMVPRGLNAGVLVDEPAPGSSVTSPFAVTGESDAYEGEFAIEIRRDGVVLATVYAVRGGAWGRWADFATSVTVDAPPGPIELVAYDAGGCGDDPDCPPILETIVPLELAGG